MNTKCITLLTLVLSFSISSLIAVENKPAQTAVADQAIQELSQFFRDNILSLQSFDDDQRKDYIQRHEKIVKERDLKAICEQYGNYWQHFLSTEEGVLRLPELEGMKPPQKNEVWTAEEYKKVTDAEVKVTDRKRLELLHKVLELSSAKQQISLLEEERQWLIKREKEAHYDEQGNPTNDFEPINHWRTYQNCMRIGELSFFYYQKLMMEASRLDQLRI